MYCKLPVHTTACSLARRALQTTQKNELNVDWLPCLPIILLCGFCVWFPSGRGETRTPCHFVTAWI